MSKILILNGSPRLHGNTSELIRAFASGAKEAGHTIARFDLQSMQIHGCKGCFGGGKDPVSPCVQKDDMEKIYPVYEQADIVVLASPMYYWSITGQLKCAFDRLFAVAEKDPNYANPKKKVVLLIAAEGNTEDNFEPVKHYYNALLKHMRWSSSGEIFAGGVFNIGDIKGHPALEQAYQLGKKL